jgi:hypothetical protein
MWRDESLPFGLSLMADEQRYAELQRAVGSAKDAQGKLSARLKRFAEAYLGFDKQPTEKRNQKTEGKDIDSLIGELVGFKRVKRGQETVTVPLYTDFWGALAPDGERIACDGFDESASDDTFRGAIGRLPPNARRYRAEYTHRAGDAAKHRKGATA